MVPEAVALIGRGPAAPGPRTPRGLLGWLLAPGAALLVAVEATRRGINLASSTG